MVYDDHYARWSYEQLILQQPHIVFGGLWRLGQQHYVLCPTVETEKTAGGEDLRGWFDQKCRVITAAIQIVSSLPQNTERVPERTALDRALLAGAPRNRRAVLVDLGLALPPEFPPFTVDNPGTDIVVVTAHQLSLEETEQVKEAYAAIGYFNPVGFSVDPTRRPEEEKFRFEFGQGDIDLLPSRRAANTCGRDLRFLMEEDEQFWVQHRSELFASFPSARRDLLPAEWNATASLGCLVDATVSAPENIRGYLSLYDTVYLALPLLGRFDSSCSALGVTSDELLKLTECGRVKILLPQSIDRYPTRWLSSVAESAPKSLLLSRRLAAATISDSQQRIPFLYPPLSPAERHTLLHALAVHADEFVGVARRGRFIRVLAELGENWAQAEWSVQSRGAMGTSHVGIGGIAAAIYEQLTGRDLRLELWSAAQKVEWAAALHAHAFPSTSDGYDETNACDLVAGVYGPSVGRQALTASHTTISVVSDLLAIDNKVSVVDFAREFSSADIRRLRKLVSRLARENVDADFLRDAIATFNAEVRRYEKRPDLLKSLNVVGLFSAGAVAAGCIDPSVQKLVPLAGIVLGFLVNRMLDEAPRYSAVAGGVIDFCNSVLTGRMNPDAVLVARVRKDVARMKR